MFISNLISVSDLYHSLHDENLIIFDCTISKVTDKNKIESEKKSLPNAVYFDIKSFFLDTNARFPNTVLLPENFEKEAQKLGVNQSSKIVVYDDLGIYSSPRVWWMFKLMGFDNIAVLDGGLVEWKENGFPTEKPQKIKILKGDFKAFFRPKLLVTKEIVLNNIKTEANLVTDARSTGRFNSEVKEPRKGVRGGHIPKSVNLPYTSLLRDNKFIETKELLAVFKKVNPYNKPYIFSCGTGITACILALGLELINENNYAVYDGSWTEWGSINELPINK